MEATVGFLDVDFVAEDALVGVSPPQMVDEVNESAERMPLDRLRHLGNVNALVDRPALLAVMGEVVRKALLGYQSA